MRTAAATTLGAMQTSYQARIGRGVAIVLWLSIPAGLVGLVVAIGVLASVHNLRSDDLVALGVVGVGSAAMAATSLFLWLRKRSRRVILTRDGIEDCQASKTTTIRWDEIDDVYHFCAVHPLAGTLGGLRVSGKSFGTLSWSYQWMGDLDALAQRIDDHVRPRLYAAARKAWDASLPIPFGPLTITREGIELGTRRLAWGSVKSLEVSSFRVWVMQEGKLMPWMMRGLGAVIWIGTFVPNAPLLSEVVSRLARRPVNLRG